MKNKNTYLFVVLEPGYDLPQYYMEEGSNFEEALQKYYYGEDIEDEEELLGKDEIIEDLKGEEDLLCAVINIDTKEFEYEA